MIISSAFSKINRIVFFSLALLISFANTVVAADKAAIELTREELKWLKENPVIRLGNSVDWPPFGFINNEGVYSGIAADYLKAIESLLGIKIEAAKLENWKATVDAARSGEVDILDVVVPTPQRRKFLIFTKPYLSYPVVIFAQKDVPYINNMSELNGQLVTVIAESALHDLLINNHPGTEIQPVENARAGLISVESGRASVFIGNLPTASRVIALEGITGLKVAGETPYRYDLSLGINKSKPILASILQKALDAISEEKHNLIHQKWMNVTFEYKVDYNLIVLFFAFIIFIFIFILLWSRHRQVKKLQQEVANRKIVEETLRDREARVAAIVDTVVDGIITINADGIIESFNPAAESMFGYEANNVIGKKVNILMPELHQNKHDEYLNHYLQSGKAKIIGFGRELEAIRSDGSVFPMELSVSEMWVGEQRKFTGVIRDITDRKKAEDALRESEASLNQAQRIAHIASWEWGISSGVIKWSDEQYRMFGLEPGQITPSYDYYFNAIHKGDRDAVQAALDKSLSGEAEYQAEFRIIKEGGEELIVNAGGIIERDDDGKPLRMVGITQDITDRYLAEKALAQGERNLATIYDTIDSVVFKVNIDSEGEYIFVDVNKKFLGATGLDRDFVVGKRVSEVIPSPSKNMVLSKYNEAILRKKTVYWEETSDYPTGTKTADVVVTPSFDEEGNFEHLIGTVHDITDRKLVEKELYKHKEHLEELVLLRTKELSDLNESLLESESYFKFALNAAKAGTLIHDFTSASVIWDERSCEIFGIKKEDFAGRYESWAERVHPDDLKKTESTVDKQVKSGQVVDVRYRCIWPEGDIRYVWAVAQILRDEEGNPYKLIGLHFDETELSLAQQELLKSKESAEVASRSKSVFLANMSHELRTPLNVILGYAHILQNDQTIYSGHKEKIKIIERSGEHLLEQISDILDVAKIEANKIELFPTAINIKHFINTICNYFISFAGIKGIDLICKIDDSINLAVAVDERRLQQILLNLIGNAINFTEKGKVIVQLEACEAVIDNSEKKCCLRFSVEDTGIGIAKEKMQQIFQPFVQLKHKNHQGEGTGLGLNIAQQLVKLMGGELKVESEVNKGSRFWFDLILPVSEEARKPYIAIKETPIGYHGKKRRILAVDDMKDSREVTRDMLKRLGFQVVVASKGLDALIMARDMQPDLILMDLLMPGLNGYESLTTLRNIPECKNTLVVAMSASVSEEKAAMLAGFDYFLPKPTTPEHFISTLGKLLNLQWVYTSTKLDVEEAGYASVPIAELEKLKDLAQLGKMKRIVEWADLQLSDTCEFSDFAIHIRDLAKDVKDAQIIALLEDYLNDSDLISG